MLDFHLGTEGIENPGEHLGGLSADAIYWLQQNDFIVKGETGHLPDDSPKSFPIGDDVVLSHEDVEAVYSKFKIRLEKAQSVPGFKSADVETLENILKAALEHKSGLSTIAD